MDPKFALALNGVLYTDRLVLEPTEGSHAESMFPLMQDPAIYEWISVSPPASLEELKSRWSKYHSRLSPDGTQAWLNWAVKRVSDGLYVGNVDACVDTDKVATNVGYTFFPRFWGMGYASEAVSGLTDHLISFGIKKLVATVTVGNTRSYRILEKAGYIKSRIIPDNDMIRGQKYDDVELVRSCES